MNHTRRLARSGLGLLLLASGLGCQRSLATCDITQSACQEDIYFHMLSLRGDGYDPFGGLPPVSVITEDQFRQQLIQEQADASKSGPSPWDQALLLLHFTTSNSVPIAPADGGASDDGGVGSDDGGPGSDAGNGPSTIDDEVAHVYAYYDPTTKKVTIISHPGQTDAGAWADEMITLAHELVHALQDRELDLNKENFQSTDGYFAYDTIIEGDARFYEILFANDLLHLGWSQSNIAQLPDRELSYDYTHFDELGSSMFAARALVYPLGAKYEATAWQSGGSAAVRHGYAKEPQHMVGFLVGADGRAPPVVSGNACPASAVTLASLPTVGEDEFGALLFYTFLRGWNVDHTVAFATAQTWTGDFIRVQADQDLTTTAATWRIELSAPPPSEIVQTLTGAGALAVTSSAKSIEIKVSDSPTPLTWKATSCP